MAKIMIVDDDPNIALLLELTLRKDGGFDVVKYENGQAALDNLEDENPDLILLDVMMPGIDGYEVCRRIKSSSKTKYISVIILSAKRELEDKIKGMNIGADDYIVKPFNPEELLIRIHVQLRMRRLEVELVDKKKLETIIAMAVTMQHEINNPLAGIQGNADLLRDWRDMKEHEVDDLVKIILEQTRRITVIIKEMSSATKVAETSYLGKTKMINIKALKYPEGGE